MAGDGLHMLSMPGRELIADEAHAARHDMTWNGEWIISFDPSLAGLLYEYLCSFPTWPINQ